MNALITTAWMRLLHPREERGQTMVEYGLILALLSIVAAAVLVILGGSVIGIFQHSSDCLSSASGTGC